MLTRAFAKRLAGQGLFAARLDAVLLRNAAVVVAFHRVRETDATDSLSVDVETFERYCRYFAKHFRVVPLRDLVYRLEHNLSVDRRLAITFDDGYLDNFDNARPILERLSLPATFFVVSDWVGTDVIPWWDRERGVRYPWMTWNEVGALRRRGFDIGGHTRTHVDLGSLPPEEARDEILGARLELEKRIRAPIDLFAHPYGGRNHLTEANRSLVRAAGYRCCCSGFGGVNVAGTDPFRLRRVPISPFHESPHQFGFDIALGRSELPA